jgi:hypothetical protein
VTKSLFIIIFLVNQTRQNQELKTLSHDDVTLEVAAVAFQEPPKPELCDQLKVSNNA